MVNVDEKLLVNEMNLLNRLRLSFQELYVLVFGFIYRKNKV